MRRLLLSLVVLAAAGCSDPASPVAGLPIYPAWFLSTVDGEYPPIPDGAGGTLVAASLGFTAFTTRGGGEGSGIVRYSVQRMTNGTPQLSTTEYDFSISEGLLRINLCPRFALCTAVPSSLVGPVAGRTGALVLTRQVGGQTGPVFRFEASLPD